MALSQLITQVPGTLIKSGDWNNEFQNILIHPIALISPTTGAINFNLQAHTNLIPTALSATSGSAGQVLTIVGAAPAWAAPTPAVLTTGTVSTGAIFAISSSGVTTLIPQGTAGQVLTVGTTDVPPSFQTPAAASGSFDPLHTLSFHEDFFADNTTISGGTGVKVFDHVWNVTGVSSGALLQPNGVLRLAAGAGGSPGLFLGVNASISTGLDSNLIVSATQNPTLKIRWMTETTASDGQLIVGLASTGTFVSTTVTGGGAVPAGAVYFMCTSGGGAVSLVTISSSGQSTLASGVTSTAFHTYQAAITTSQVTLTVDGVLVGNLTSNMPSSGLSPGAGFISTGGWRIDYINITSTS